VLEIEVTPDTPLHWLLCGDECSGHFVGPHLTVEEAESDAARCDLGHGHVVFNMTIRQFARTFRGEVFFWSGSIWKTALVDGVEGYATAVKRAVYPLRSADLGLIALPMLMEEVASCAV
jgi:hypothetical protein